MQVRHKTHLIDALQLAKMKFCTMQYAGNLNGQSA